ncbi:MAG: glycosyltransferase family 4 protein, partial [Candidatus Hydrogenedentes bacterium]|nr:glycosyltransferase family 4 protein [Candidatus Hydrogenedentota bacterium]
AWHLQGFKRLRGAPTVTAFRAESQIQDHFRERGDGTDGMQIERIYFDTQAGSALARAYCTFAERYRGRTPRVLPFHDRLKDFDIVHSWELFTDWSESALEARARYHVPLAITVWDLLPFNMERGAGRRELKRRVAEGADRFVVYTERSRAMLAFEGVRAERIAYVPPGVDTDLFCPGIAARTFGLRDDDFVVLFVGWFVPRKGIDFVLFALRKLIDEGGPAARRVKLLIVGSGAGRERVEALIARLDLQAHCVLPGAQSYERMPEAFRMSDAFVLPSVASDEWQEQFGMSLIEAMACGKPCIATLSGAIEEIAGDAALLVQPNDFLALYRALRRLLNHADERARLGAEARARARRQFDLALHVTALSDLYDGMLK